MSIYRQALGEEFLKLHPEIQKRFGLNSQNAIASRGEGFMDSVWRGPMHTLPFLYIGAWRNIMFPAKGTNIPFTVENYAYQDRFGRETVTWIRTFHFPNRVRRFDATMIYSHQRKRIVDYLGTHQHLAVDIHLSVAKNGGLRLRSGEQRFYEGPLAFRFPMYFSGYADVCEWFDDQLGKLRIEVVVRNKVWGRLFGYNGSFDVEYIAVDRIPPNLKPLREERRE